MSKSEIIKKVAEELGVKYHEIKMCGPSPISDFLGEISFKESQDNQKDDQNKQN